MSSAIFFNFNCPPEFDEAHAYNIARYLSPLELFTVSKTEGHPFLWYLVLMPIAKTHFLYPYALYTLNFLIIALAFYFLYKFAPFPAYLKYFITLSAPFLQLYTPFARNYSLTILFLFILLSLYSKRHQKQKTFLTFILLLANTNLIGLSIGFSLGTILFLENIRDYSKNKKPLFISLSFAIIELLLLIAQFYGCDTKIPSHTPMGLTLYEKLNNAFAPLNIYIFAFILSISLIFFYKTKRFNAVAFLSLSTIGLLALLFFIYNGAIHHHHFFYIILIASFWLADIKAPFLTHKQLFPLTFLAFCLIFNPHNQQKLNHLEYLRQLKTSTNKLNRLYSKKNLTLLSLEPFEADIIRPYLNNNITILNQTATDITTLKAIQEYLYYFYIPYKTEQLLQAALTTENFFLFYRCGAESYQHGNMVIHLNTKLNDTFCLYTVSDKQN